MGTYTAPTWNHKKLNFRPNFPVDRGSQIFPQEVVQDFGARKKKKIMHSQNFESPNIYNLMQVSRSEHQEAQPGE